MAMLQRFILMAACIPVAGCASTITALSNMPITSDHLDEPGEDNKLKTVSGDRRLVRVQRYTEKPTFVVCAETQADAIAARAAQSALTVNGRGSASDAYAETLAITTARGQVSDTVRQLAWHICNAQLNGAYGKEPGGYAKRLDKLQHDAMAVLMAGTTTPAPGKIAQPVPGTLVTVTISDAPAPPAEAPPACKPTKEKPCPEKAAGNAK